MSDWRRLIVLLIHMTQLYDCLFLQTLHVRAEVGESALEDRVQRITEARPG